MKYPKKIFIVEDNKIEILRIKKLLKESNNVECILYFPNGLTAIQKLKSIIKNQDLLPDFIILDLNMPIMNGFEFLIEINKNERLKAIPIFINSSTISIREYNDLKNNINVKGLFIKPFSLIDLDTIFTTYNEFVKSI